MAIQKKHVWENLDTIYSVVSRLKDDEQISFTKLSRLLFLVDWRACLFWTPLHARNTRTWQASVFKWVKGDTGPEAEGLRESAQVLFDTSKPIRKDSVTYLWSSTPTPAPWKMEFAERVLNATRNLPPRQFIEYVYNSHPMCVTRTYQPIDLTGLAREWRERYG